MTPENQNHEPQPKEENATIPHQADMDTQTAAQIPEEKVLSEIDPEKTSEETPKPEGENPENKEIDDTKHLADREKIVERLKNLYTNAEPGTNLFKAIREIKADWQNAGSVSKSVFKNVSNNYFFHMKQFYQMLDMNKEYLEQEFSHNLERRNQIIERAKELENEPSVQKALNELQYLHKVWKDEAGPVAEEFRESTWQAFKEISNKIHGRRDELSQEMDAARTENLEKKNRIIAEIRAFVATADKTGHNFWQQAIKKVDALREEFMSTGGVPKNQSAQSWNDFKDALREFNSAKNDFYKNSKESQSANLEKKRALIQAAKDNAASEDWENAVPLYKKLQEEWKEIGHVPRNLAEEIWTEFREACNQFFENFRSKNKSEGDDWKANFTKKQQILERLKNASEEDQDGISAIKKEWDETGKVPRDKMAINSEFNKIFREKSKLAKSDNAYPRNDRYANAPSSDRARKVKNQISDLEAEIATLENNLGFFSNSSRENPLLKDTYGKIDSKKSQLEQMKKELHELLSAE